MPLPVSSGVAAPARAENSSGQLGVTAREGANHGLEGLELSFEDHDALGGPGVLADLDGLNVLVSRY